MRGSFGWLQQRGRINAAIADMVEAQAIRSSQLIARRLGYAKVVIESDAIDIVNASMG